MLVVTAAVALGIGQPLDSVGRDPSGVEAEAKEAQARFERGRRNWLPVTGSSSGRCDERIGRFCYWYDEADTTMPEEPAALRRSRADLLTILERAQALAPRSDWIIGQRVRYLTDQGMPDSAVAVTAGCTATRWWCLALTGLGLHAAERFELADSAFAAAIAAMPEATRCRWTDWRVLLGGDAEPTQSQTAPCSWGPRTDTLLWLAKPLLSSPGNDLRTELLARRAMATIQASGMPPQLMAWGNDLEEMTLRYGWSKRWSRSSYPSSVADPPSLVGHDRPPGYWFFPFPADSTARWRWNLSADRPRARYAPSYADRIQTTDDVAIAVFTRGDSAVVVAAVGEVRDTVFRSNVSVLSLVAETGLRARPSVVELRGTSLSNPLVLRMRGDPRLVGVEARSADGRRHLRSRLYRPERSVGDHPILSDPLLFQVDTELPSSLEAAARRAIAGRRISRREAVGVYWELSGPRVDSVDVAVSVVPVRRGLLGRLAQGLTLVKQRVPLTLQWRAGGVTTDVEGRAIELDLSHLELGSHLLQLVALSGSSRATTVTRFELVP